MQYVYVNAMKCAIKCNTLKTSNKERKMQYGQKSFLGKLFIKRRVYLERRCMYVFQTKNMHFCF